MKKIFLAAGTLLILSQSPAQTIIQVDNSQTTEAPFKTELDEKTANNLNDEVKLPEKLIRMIPVTYNRELSYNSEPIGKRKAILTAEESGKLVFSTHYKRNQLQGLWISLYSNGARLDSGHFNNNIPDGEWRSWYPGGKLRSIRTYSSGKYFAVSNEIKRRNEKIMYYPLTRIGLIHPAGFENLTSSGYSFISMPSSAGVTYVPPFVNCLHHGLYMNFYATGAVKDSGYYVDGMRDGIWDEYYENGQLKTSGYYYKGQKNSGWKYYSSKGKLTMLCEFKNGKLSHRKKY